MPVAEAATEALTVGLKLPAAALVLPVRMSVAWSAPAAVRVVAPEVAVMPFGSPVILYVALAALEASETPPTGVSVTIKVCLLVELMAMLGVESAMLIAGAGVT